MTKIGYEEHFDRNIMGVVIPVLENKKLVGIVYSYIPLKSIKDLIYDMGLILAPLALAITLLTIWIGRKIIIAITKPLSQWNELPIIWLRRDSQNELQFLLKMKLDD